MSELIHSVVRSACFVPLAVMETYRLYKRRDSDFRDIGRRIAVATGKPQSTQFLFQRLSIAYYCVYNCTNEEVTRISKL